MFNTRKIALLGLLGRKKQTLLTISAISLAIAFIITILNMQDSIRCTEEEQRKDIYGEWQGAVYNINDDVIEQLCANVILDQFGLSSIYSTVLDEYGAIVGNLGIMDENSLELGRISLAEGDFPTAENEIAIEKSLLDDLGLPYIVGEEITLTMQDTDETTYAFKTVQKTFVLSGILNNYSSLWKNSNNNLAGAIVSSNFQYDSQSIIKNNVFFTVKDEYLDNMNALELLLYTKGFYVINDYTYYYLNASYSNLEEKIFNNSIIYIVVLITSIFIIFNIFSVIFQKRKNSYHILRIVGAKKLKIISLAIYEIICIIAIAFPLGIILGFVFSFITFFVMKGLGIAAIIKFTSIYNYAIPMGIILVALIIGMSFPMIGLLKNTLSAKEKEHFPRTNRRLKNISKEKIIKTINQPLARKRVMKTLLPILSFVIIMIALSNCFIKYLEGLPNKYYDSDYEYASFLAYYENPGNMTDDALEKIKNTFGVESVNAFQISKYYPITLENNQEQSEYELITIQYIFLKYAKYNQLASVVHGIDSDSEAFVYYENQIQLGSINRDKFDRGEEIILYLPIYQISEKNTLEESNGYQENDIKESTIAVGDAITIHGDNGDVTVTVGGIIYTFDNENIKSKLKKPFSMISSYKLNEKLHLPGTKPTYQYVQVKTNEKANYIRTDKELSTIKTELNFWNYRDQNVQAKNNAHVKIILYTTLTITIFFLSCMLQLNSYYMSFHRIQNKIGILWALGIEKKQYISILLKHSIIVNCIAIMLGLSAGFSYLNYRGFSKFLIEYFDFKMLLILLGIIIVYFFSNLFIVFIACKKIFGKNINYLLKN